MLQSNIGKGREIIKKDRKMKKSTRKSIFLYFYIFLMGSNLGIIFRVLQQGRYWVIPIASIAFLFCLMVVIIEFRKS